MISFRRPCQDEFDSLNRAHWTVEDWKAVFVIASLFVVMLLGSWQRWTQPIIDHGREMNLPARVAAGEQLYVDVQFLYGPFTPYLNSLLYRIFGVRLGVLHVAGGISAWIILVSIYWLSRQLMSVWEAALTTCLVVVLCAIKYSANYISPYAYAALYGLVFSITSLAMTVRYWRDDNPRWLLVSGVLAGFAVISKWELALTALAAAAVAMLLRSLASRTLMFQDALRFLAPVLLIPGATLGLLLMRVPWRTLVEDNHIFFTAMPPQLVYFNQYISGIVGLPKSLWYTLSGLGMFSLWVGVIVMVGSIVARRRGADWWRLALTGFVLTLSGLIFWILVRAIFRIPGNATLITAMPLVLPCVIGFLSIRAWERRGGLSKEMGVLLLLAVFAFVSILRVIFKVSVTGPYVPFYLPVVVVVATFLLFSVLPAVIASLGELREGVRKAAIAVIFVLVIGIGAGSIRRFQLSNTFEVSAPRGAFKTEPKIGKPLADAINYVRENSPIGSAVLTLPQATSINYLAERAYPYREEIVHPGFVTDDEAIRRLESRDVPLVLVVNLLTPEFRDRVFGVDYNPGLWRWINDNYQLVARFDSSESRGAELGDEPFFILAFKKRR